MWFGITSDLDRRAASAGLRVAIAGSICMIVSAIFHLGSPAQSVYTAHIVNIQYPQGPFQKGIERILGRISGVLFGATAAVLFHSQPILCIVLVSSAQFVVWYLNSAGWLQYAALHFGIFASAIAAMGLCISLEAAVITAEETAFQVLLGVLVANVVNFLAGVDRPHALVTPSLETVLHPQTEWISRSLLITTASLVAMFVSGTTGLPIIQTMVAAMVIGVMPDLASMEQKALQRGLAALAAGAYGLLALTFLVHSSHYVILVGFIFAALFVSHYITNVSQAYQYFGMQIGMVTAMVLLGPPAELNDLRPVTQRFVGVLVGTVIALTLVAIWPRLPAAGTVAAPIPEPTNSPQT